MKQLYGSGDGVKVNEIKGLYFLLAVNISNPPPQKKNSVKSMSEKTTVPSCMAVSMGNPIYEKVKPNNRTVTEVA